MEANRLIYKVEYLTKKVQPLQYDKGQFDDKLNELGKQGYILTDIRQSDFYYILTFKRFLICM